MKLGEPMIMPSALRVPRPLRFRAIPKLAEQGSPYYPVLRDHLKGRPQDRNRLWNARRRLVGLIRAEVAETVDSPEELEAEVAYLPQFLRPAGNR